MPSNTLRTAHHLTCASAAGGLMYLAYLYQTEGQGLHPWIAGLLIGCLIVLSMCYPDDPFTLDDEPSESTQNHDQGPAT